MTLFKSFPLLIAILCILASGMAKASDNLVLELGTAYTALNANVTDIRLAAAKKTITPAQALVLLDEARSALTALDTATNLVAITDPTQAQINAAKSDLKAVRDIQSRVRQKLANPSLIKNTRVPVTQTGLAAAAHAGVR